MCKYTEVQVRLVNGNGSLFRFLDVLAARKDPAGLSGEVLINGAPQPPNFKCLSGYVVQVGETGRKPDLQWPALIQESFLVQAGRVCTQWNQPFSKSVSVTYSISNYFRKTKVRGHTIIRQQQLF